METSTRSGASAAEEAAAEAAAAEAAVRQLSDGARALGEWARPLSARLLRAQRRLDSLEANVAAMAVFGADGEQALKRLEARVGALEAAVERALVGMFPRVEALLAHLEFLALPPGRAAAAAAAAPAPAPQPSRTNAAASSASPPMSASACATSSSQASHVVHPPVATSGDCSSSSITPKPRSPKSRPSLHRLAGSNLRLSSAGSKTAVSDNTTASNSKTSSPNSKSTSSSSKIVLICRSKSSGFKSSSGNITANPGRPRGNSLAGESSHVETRVLPNVLQDSPDALPPLRVSCQRMLSYLSKEISPHLDSSASSKTVRGVKKTGSVTGTNIEGPKIKSTRPSLTTLIRSCNTPSSITSTSFSTTSTTGTSSASLFPLPTDSTVPSIKSICERTTSTSKTAFGVPLESPTTSTPPTSSDTSSSPHVFTTPETSPECSGNKNSSAEDRGERRRRNISRPTSSSDDARSSLSNTVASTSITTVDRETLPVSPRIVRTMTTTDDVSPTTNTSPSCVTTFAVTPLSAAGFRIGPASPQNLSSSDSDSSSLEQEPSENTSSDSSDDVEAGRSTGRSEAAREGDTMVVRGSAKAARACVQLSEATRRADAGETAEATGNSESADLSEVARTMEVRAVKHPTAATTSEAVGTARTTEHPEAEEAAEVLLQAARDGDIARLEALLEEGRCEVDAACGATGGTVAHWAALRGRADLLRLLLRRGADARRRDASSWTPLHAAAFGRSARCVELLVAAGAELEAADRDGWTALHVAAVREAAGATRALLAAGASPRARDRDGRNPAHLAASPALRRLLRTPPQQQQRDASDGEADVCEACGVVLDAADACVAREA